MEGKNPRPPYVPTPDEIKEVCQKIRDGWNARQWGNQTSAKDWEVPRSQDPDFKPRGPDSV
jgi:hypothetical protein